MNCELSSSPLWPLSSTELSKIICNDDEDDDDDT